MSSLGRQDMSELMGCPTILGCFHSRVLSFLGCFRLRNLAFVSETSTDGSPLEMSSLGRQEMSELVGSRPFSDASDDFIHPPMPDFAGSDSISSVNAEIHRVPSHQSGFPPQFVPIVENTRPRNFELDESMSRGASKSDAKMPLSLFAIATHKIFQRCSAEDREYAIASLPSDVVERMATITAPQPLLRLCGGPPSEWLLRVCSCDVSDLLCWQPGWSHVGYSSACFAVNFNFHRSVFEFECSANIGPQQLPVEGPWVSISPRVMASLVLMDSFCLAAHGEVLKRGIASFLSSFGLVTDTWLHTRFYAGGHGCLVESNTDARASQVRSASVTFHEPAAFPKLLAQVGWPRYANSKQKNDRLEREHMEKQCQMKWTEFGRWLFCEVLQPTTRDTGHKPPPCPPSPTNQHKRSKFQMDDQNVKGNLNAAWSMRSETLLGMKHDLVVTKGKVVKPWMERIAGDARNAA